jgi:hypothetical protein
MVATNRHYSILVLSAYHTTNGTQFFAPVYSKWGVCTLRMVDLSIKAVTGIRVSEMLGIRPHEQP